MNDCGYMFSDENIADVAKELEAEGKITEDACIAYLCGDQEGYEREMKDAAWAVLLEHEPEFLSQEKIAELVDIYGDPPEDMKTLNDYSEPEDELEEDLKDDLNAKNETDTEYDYGRQLALSNPNPVPYDYGAEQSSGGSIIWGGLKWLFMNAAGLGVPYAGYKVVKALASGKGAAAVVAGVAATVGLDVDTH